MIPFQPPRHSIPRRQFLEIGSLSVLGLTLADWLRAQDRPRPPRAVILMYLPGGLSHFETYDPKPDAPDVFHGPLGTIRTKVPGLHLGEMLPEQAKVADKLVVIRSLHHRSGDHPAAMHLWKTGHRGGEEPNREARHPSAAAIAARLCGKRRDLPGAVVVNHDATHYDGAVYLGPAAQPLGINLDYQTLTPVTEGLRLPAGVTLPRFTDRRELLRRLDTLQHDLDRQAQMAAVDSFRQQALELVLGDAARRALDLEREDPRTRDRYGRTYFGQMTLLARRLVEAGVPFVTVNRGGNVFDHHERIVPLLREHLPPVDRAVAALIGDLDQRGLLNDVLVCLLTDFGRDQMNAIGGRHHWPECGSAMLAGGGLRGGQVVGASDRHGRFPAETPLQPADVLTMIYRHLGIPLDSEFTDYSGRPVPINNGGQLIKQLLE
jgi:hypothetical protein